jgi:hypothetical protein
VTSGELCKQIFLRQISTDMLKVPSVEDNWNAPSYGPNAFVKVPWDCGLVLAVRRKQRSVLSQADNYRGRFTATT